MLPLQNLSADPAQEFFVDGMTEALIGRLSTIQGIRVISRTSTMHFKGTPPTASGDCQDAARRRHHRGLGRALRQPDRGSRAQLIRRATDDHLWSGSYDRELRDVLTLQDEVTHAIARQIQITVGGRESGRRAARRVSPDAYEDYLKGRFALNGSPTPSLDDSVRYFEAAIAEDSMFAPAYSGLGSRIHAAQQPAFGGAFPAMRRRKQPARPQQALELDSELAEAHVVLGEAWCDSGSGTSLKRATARRDRSEPERCRVRTPGRRTGCCARAVQMKRSSRRSVRASWIRLPSSAPISAGSSFTRAATVTPFASCRPYSPYAPDDGHNLVVSRLRAD